jgi:hypothetical protein
MKPVYQPIQARALVNKPKKFPRNFTVLDLLLLFANRITGD